MEQAVRGNRQHFSVLATPTPKLLIDEGSRQCVVIYNNTAVNVYIGETGSAVASWMILPTNTVFHDLYSSDSWWVASASSSGTVSGYGVY